MPESGILVVADLIMSVDDVAFRDQAIWLSGSIVADRVIAKGEVLTGIRWLGSDGSLITNIPDAELVMPDNLQPGGYLVVSIDVRFDTPSWGGQN